MAEVITGDAGEGVAGLGPGLREVADPLSLYVLVLPLAEVTGLGDLLG